MGAYATVKSSSANILQTSQSVFNKSEIPNMTEPSDEREEGEIVDEYEDIISSDEEFSMRQRIEELEAKNAELEKIANISGVFGSGTYDYNKHDPDNYQTDRYPLISIDISDEEDYPPLQTLSRISRRRKSFQHSHSRRKMIRSGGSSRSRREKSSSPPPAPLFRPSDKFLLSMFHSRITNHSHSNKRKRKNKKPHSMKSSRKSRVYYVSESDVDCNVDADDSYVNLSGCDEDYPFNRDELRSALARNTRCKEQKVSLKDRLIRRKENTDTLNEKTKEKSKDVVEEQPKPELPEDKSEPEDNTEEQELRIIALKSAVLRKHLVRKKRNENVAYSPSDFDDICPKIVVSPSMNNIEDVDEACNSMEISPVPSPTMMLSDDEEMNTIPVDMDIANSDSDCELPPYEKWIPIEQIPLPNGTSGEICVPKIVRCNNAVNGESIPPEVRFDSLTVSPACFSEEEEEEVALRALLLAKMNSPKVQKIPKEEPRRVEEVGTPDREISLEAEALRNFLINNMKKRARPRQSPAGVLKEAVRRLTAKNEDDLLETTETMATFHSRVYMDQKYLDEFTTEMSEFKMENESNEFVKSGDLKSIGKTEEPADMKKDNADNENQDYEEKVADLTEGSKNTSSVSASDDAELSQQPIEEIASGVREKSVKNEVECYQDDPLQNNDIVVKKEKELFDIPLSQKKDSQAGTGEVLIAEADSEVKTESAKASSVILKKVLPKQGTPKPIDAIAQKRSNKAPTIKEEKRNSDDKWNTPLILKSETATENEKSGSRPTAKGVSVNQKKVLVEKTVKNNNPNTNNLPKIKPKEMSVTIPPKKGAENKTKLSKDAHSKFAKNEQATPLICTNKIKVEDENKSVKTKSKVQTVSKIVSTTQVTQKNFSKTSAQRPNATLTKIVKPNKVINKQNIDLKRKPIENSAKPSIPVKKVKTDNASSTNRLITAADMPQVEKLVIELRASDTESEYSTMSDDESNRGYGENSSISYFINRSATIENDFYDIASPISLAMESPYDTPTRSASPAVRVSSPQPLVAKSIANDFFEAKLDRFLKNVRSKVADSTTKPTKELSVPATAPLNTPVAVRHLPQASQQEYRRLINRMKLLERQKQAKNLQIVVKTSDGATEDESRIVIGSSKGSGQALETKVLMKNSPTKAPICDKTSFVAQKQNKTSEEKPSTSSQSVISSQKATPPKTMSVSPLKTSTENQLILYESFYLKTGASIILHLDKSIEMVQEAKEAKIAKLKHEYRLQQLQKEMDDVQQKIQHHQERITKIYPEMYSSHRVIETLKTRRGKLNKAVTNLGRTVIGDSYCINNNQKEVISEKIKKLAAEIKLVNTMKLGDVDKWESRNQEKSSSGKPAIVTPPKDLHTSNIESPPAVKNDKSIMPSSTYKVPETDTQNPTETATTDVGVPEVTRNLESKPIDTIIVPETLPNKEDQNASSNGHEKFCNEILQEAIETQPLVDKPIEEGGTDEKKLPLLGEVKLQDYVSPLLHLRDERQINPNGIVCPYQLKGQCDDKDCKYTHLEE